MNTTSRALRRRLQLEGTSYQDILAEVRCNLAKEYLRTTRMSTEDIAESLGFSDAANFRDAFRRWTGKNPSEFRRCGSGLTGKRTVVRPPLGQKRSDTNVLQSGQSADLLALESG